MGSFRGCIPCFQWEVFIFFVVWAKKAVRADVRADDAELYATVEGIVLTGRAVTRDLTLQGPVMVTAGAPIYVPPSNSHTH